MLRLLRSPRWLAGHVVVLVAVAGFANLGLWQLDRLEQRRSYNALLAERMAAPPLGMSALGDLDPARDAYRRLTATGTFLHEQEVLLSTRSENGQPGHHVLTPLETSGGTLLVDRGWVPLDRDSPPVADAAPPGGQVRVDGLLFPSRQARRAGALDGGEGPLQFVSDVDLGVLEEAAGEALLPLWLLAEAQEPPQPGPLPIAAAAPVLSEGSHLSYAVQWFLFALVVAVGYPLLLRRTYRDRREEDERAGGPSPASHPPPPSAPEPPVAVR